MTADTPTAAKPRRALVWWGVGLLISGVLLGVAGVAFFFGTAGSQVIATFTAPVRTTPADFTVDLDEGTYVIYEQTGVVRGSGTITTTRGRPATITPGDVEVVSASGQSVPVVTMGVTETIDRGSQQFTGAARFTVVDEGTHRVRVKGVGQQIFVAPSVTSSFRAALPWLALVGIGALVAVIGLILLIVGLVRGRRPAASLVAPPGSQPAGVDPGAVLPVAVAPTVMPAAVAPGWFPDPKGEARLRWWDGQQWTDNVS